MAQNFIQGSKRETMQNLTYIQSTRRPKTFSSPRPTSCLNWPDSMAVSLFTVRRFLIIFSIAWLILLTDHALLLWWLDWPVELAIIDSLISNILLLLACLLVMNTV